MKLIVHGDDFGLTKGINLGIVDSFCHGILRSTSIVAGGEAFEDALSLIKKHPGLDVGVHLVLCDEKPVADLINIYKGRDISGQCLPGRQNLVKAICIGKMDYNAVRLELCAQIEKILDAGIKPSHLDSHQFIHLLPGIFPICIDLQKKYKIPFMRTILAEPLSLGPGPKRLLQWAMLGSWIRAYVRGKIPKDLPVIPCTGFLYAGGKFTAKSFISTIKRFSRFQALEIMLHPGAGDSYTADKYAGWEYAWEKDTAICTDLSLARDLKKAGVEFISFKDLAS